MRARLLLAGSVSAVVLGSALAASASTQPLPVSITNDGSKVCVTISKQVPQCVPISIATTSTTVTPPVQLPYRKGDEICWDPTPTSKGPCIPITQS